MNDLLRAVTCFESAGDNLALRKREVSFTLGYQMNKALGSVSRLSSIDQLIPCQGMTQRALYLGLAPWR